MKNAVCLAILLVGLGSLASAQLAHFVSPQYPPLAKAAGITGQVSLKVNVSKDGSVTDASPNGSPPNPYLLPAAKECVRDWKFEKGIAERTVKVSFVYGFSEKVSTDGQISVQADFGSAIRVFVMAGAVLINPSQSRNGK